MTKILPWFSKAQYAQTQCINKTQINSRVQCIGLGYHQSSSPISPQMVLVMHWLSSLWGSRHCSCHTKLISSSLTLKPGLCCVAGQLLQLWSKSPQLSQCLQCSVHNKIAKSYMVGLFFLFFSYRHDLQSNDNLLKGFKSVTFLVVC